MKKEVNKQNESVKSASSYIKDLIWVSRFCDRLIIFLYLLLQIGSVASEMLIPVEIGKIFGVILDANNSVLVKMYIEKLLVLVIISIILTVLCNRFKVAIKENPILNIQKRTLDHLFHLGIPFFEESEKGYVFSIFNTTIPLIKDIFERFLPELARNGISVIISLILFIMYSGWLGVFVLLCLIPNLFIHKFFNAKIAKMMSAQISKRQVFDKNVYTSISAMKEVRAYQCEDWQAKKIEESYVDYKECRLKTLKVRYTRGMFFRLNTALGITIYFALAVFSVYTNRIAISNLHSMFFFLYYADICI